MEWALAGLYVFVALFILLVIGVPVGFAMASIAISYVLFRWGPNGVLMTVAQCFTTVGNYLLLAAPLFIFMGECVALSGVGNDAFKVLDNWLGFVPGGLTVSTVGSAAAFGAATGFSATGIAALGPIVLREMFSRNYNREMAMGALGAGAALAVLIPPSVPFIVYGFLSGASISAMFFAGVIPGILGMLMFMAYVAVRAHLNPSLAPRSPGVSWKERLATTWRILPFLLLIIAVLGSIWMGVATPTEAASVGCFGSLVLIAVYGRLTWPTFKTIVMRTLRTTTMTYVIVMGASALGQVLGATGFITNFAQLVTSLPVSPWVIILIIMAANLIFGCFMSTLGVLFLTLPIYLPIVEALHINLIWFGVLIVVNTEIGCLTPPVGMNLYFLKAIAPPEISFTEVVRSIIPFIGLYAILMILVALIPQLSLWLPSLMQGQGL